MVYLLPLLFIGPAAIKKEVNRRNSATIARKIHLSSPDDYFSEGKMNLSNDKIDLSVSQFNKASELYLQKNEIIKAASSLIYSAECYRLLGNIPKAHSSLSQMQRIALNKIKENSEVFADFYRTQGTIALMESDNEKAIQSSRKSIDIRIGLNGKKDTSLIFSYNLLGSVYSIMGNYNEALSNYEKAENLTNFTKASNGYEHADILYNIANLYIKKGDYNKALNYQLGSGTILENLYPGNDKHKLDHYVGLGYLNQLLGHYSDAIANYDLASNIFATNKIDNPLTESYVMLNKGTLYENMGDLEKAESCYDYILNKLKSDQVNNSISLGRINHNLGIISYKKADYTDALQHYKNAEIYKSDCSSDEIAKTHSGIAGCYSQLGDKKQASKYYELAILEHVKAGNDQSFDLARDYLSYGTFCFQNGYENKGRKLIKMALDINLELFGSKYPETSKCYQFLGDILESEGKTSNAITYYQKAIIASSEDFYSENIYDNPSLSGKFFGPELLSALKKKAYLLSNEGANGNKGIENLQNGLSAYEQALKLIHKMRTSFSEYNSKLFVSSQEKETYDDAIFAALNLYSKTHDSYYKEKAFNFAELSKSAVLLSSLQEKKALHFGGVPDTLLRREASINKSIESFQSLIQLELLKNNSDKNQINYWEGEIFKLKSDQEQLVRFYENEYPNYFALKYDDNSIDIPKLRRQLSPKQAFIEFVVTDTKILSFLATTDRFEVFQTNKPADFDGQLSSLRKYLDGKDFTEQKPEKFNAYLNASSQLYQYLLKPCEPFIASRELIIVPDDKLSSIPFEVLLTSPVSSVTEFTNLPYLIKKNAVGYAYSANLLFVEQEKPDNKLPSLAAFAPSYESFSGQNTGIFTYRDALKPLPFAGKEASMVSNIFNGKVYTDLSANKTKFKQVAGNYDILHLSMHTIIDNNNPMYSKLAFTGIPEKGDDGLLNTYEIFNMQLKAKMAVLSACNTGVGKMDKGEGMMSLARGFYYAGCPDVVMTLWPVEDQISSSLIKDFYNYLAQGKDKIEALRMAKLNYLKTADPLRSHPYFWAAYVNIGNVSPITTNDGHSSNYLGIIGSILGLFLLLLPIIRKVF